MSQTLRILHIEDNPKDAILIEERLRSEGIEADILIISSEDKFKKALEEIKFDLVICDYSLPGFNGQKALEIVREKFPEVPFIYVSGTIGEEKAVELLRSGATDYIIKDNLKRLTPAIRRALNDADIIKKKLEAERELRESKHFIQQIVDTSPNMIYIYDLEEKRNVFVNAKLESLFGYLPEEIYSKGGRFLLNIIHPDDKNNFVNRLKIFDSFETGNVLEHEYRAMHKNGEWLWIRAYESVFSRTESGKVKSIIGTAQDITSRKIAEQELIKAKEKAEESDRLKSEFLAQMSHEIRTPLSAILNYTALLKMELEDDPNDLEFLFDGIDSSGKRLIRTIDLILNMSALQTGKHVINITNVNIAAILKKLISEFYSFASATGLYLKLDVSPEVNFITADDYTIAQIFQNLLDNAIKYTEKGGVAVKLYKENDYVCIDIKDTGIGISDEYLPNLFKPFSQELTGYSRKFEGNGLGLALTKKYIEINNGDISIKSKKGEGTTVTVRFKS